MLASARKFRRCVVALASISALSNGVVSVAGEKDPSNTTKSETPTPLNADDILNITLHITDDIPIVVRQDSKERDWMRT